MHLFATSQLMFTDGQDSLECYLHNFMRKFKKIHIIVESAQFFAPSPIAKTPEIQQNH